MARRAGDREHFAQSRTPSVATWLHARGQEGLIGSTRRIAADATPAAFNGRCKRRSAFASFRARPASAAPAVSAACAISAVLLAALPLPLALLLALRSDHSRRARERALALHGARRSGARACRHRSQDHRDRLRRPLARRDDTRRFLCRRMADDHRLAAGRNAVVASRAGDRRLFPTCWRRKNSGACASRFAMADRSRRGGERR